MNIWFVFVQKKPSGVLLTDNCGAKKLCEDVFGFKYVGFDEAGQRQSQDARFET